MATKKNRYFDVLSISDSDLTFIIPYRDIKKIEFSEPQGIFEGVMYINGVDWNTSKTDFDSILDKYKQWCSDCSQIEFEISILSDKVKEIDSIIEKLNSVTGGLRESSLPISILADKFKSITDKG